MTAGAEAICDTLTGMLLRQFREAIYRQVGEGLPVPVRDGTYPVLVGLRDGPATASGLGRRLGVDRTVVSRQAADLAAAGLVRRDPDVRDRRGGVLSLTTAGQEVADALRARFVDLIAAATSAWTKAERAEFERLLADLAVRLGH